MGVARRVAAGLLVLGLIGACSDDDTGEDVQDVQDVRDEIDGVAASGEPVRVGFINLEGGTSVSLPEFRIGAEAAVGYVNEELGGIAGRPVELVRCDTNGTTESSIACANEMVDEEVAVVTLGTDTNASPIVEIVTAAGIPYVTNTGNSSAELTTEGAFAWTGGVPASLGGYGAFSASQGYEKLALLVIDVPAATQAANTLGSLIFGNAGVEFQVITVPPGTPDMTSQLASAIDQGADAVALLGDPTMCTAFYSAYLNLGADVPGLVIDSCTSESILASAPDGLLEHLFVTANLRPEESGEEGDLYTRVLEEYGGDDADASAGNVAAGYATILGLVRMLDDLAGEVTSEAITAKLSTATADFPLSPGTQLRCDGSAIPSLPRVCSATEFMYQVTPERTVEFVEALDISPLFAG